MVTQELSGHTIGISDDPNPGEAEDNDLKYSFIKLIKILKEEIKIFLKEMEEKTNIKWKRSNCILRIERYRLQKFS